MLGAKTKADLQREIARLRERLQAEDARVDTWLTKLAAKPWSQFVVYGLILLAAYGLWSLVR